MKYCQSLQLPEGGNLHPIETINALRKICFINYADVEKKNKGAEITFPQYQIGFTAKSPPPHILNTINGDDNKAEEFILDIAHKIYNNVNSSAPPARLKSTIYTFITAQHICAKGILNIQFNKFIDNREGKTIKNL